MAKCAYCGTTILFGGTDLDGLRYCSPRCAAQGEFVSLSRILPASVVAERAQGIHQGRCPGCQGPGPIDVHTSYRVWSALLLTQWTSHPKVCCRTCGIKANAGSALICLLVGWWGFPWGLIMTPIQIGRNIFGMLRHPDALRPSEELKAVVRVMLVSELPVGARRDA